MAWTADPSKGLAVFRVPVYNESRLSCYDVAVPFWALAIWCRARRFGGFSWVITVCASGDEYFEYIAAAKLN